MIFRTPLINLFATLGLLGAGASSAVADDTENAKDVVAAQIRTQGLTCDKAESATRDAEASKPNEAVWVLTCDDAKYRVHLVPNMAAQVERLSKDDDSDRDK